MYLQKRRKQWYALQEIPPALRETIGRSRFVQSLGTEDRATAKRRAAPLEVRWRSEIEKARSGDTSHIEKDMEYWRKVWLQSAPEERELVESLLMDELDNKVHHAATHAGITDASDPAYQELPERQEAARAFEIATGRLVRLDEHLEEYLATLTDKQPKSVNMKRSSIKRFCEKFPYVSDVQRKGVQQWINGLVTGAVASATIRRYRSELRGYWTYLQSLEVVADDHLPFERLSLPQTPGSKGKGSRQAFTATQVTHLLRVAEDKGDAQLADLIRLAMWSGARLEELCALRVEDVADTYFKIEDAKTEAGIRQVPVHSKLKPTLDRLVKDSTDGYVLPGLRVNEYGDRSNAIGKRFGRMKKSEGYPPTLVFHSIRRTVATLLENAGVPENHAADLLGHDKKSMSYGVYSGGGYVATLAKELEKIDYPGQ